MGVKIGQKQIYGYSLLPSCNPYLNTGSISKDKFLKNTQYLGANNCLPLSLDSYFEAIAVATAKLH